ncbi:methionyl-tRNA formyltransferase [Ponticaulis sp.]|uniref:methionyl-tRNA formyltransferase n=1 Tax=Ponticaulis sp. TaxID=2020902 RepID=UPI000C6615EB|nr:methionyl-tRNA formyltransferase [Ponticaulis sp.]MBN03784.1 methionyl-tRNA formyltransferase [Ponticaulis sp.]
MRLAFMGSPDFAVPSLKALIAAGHDIVCVYSQPPRPAGRGKQLRNTPVHDAALNAGIEVRHPASLKSQEEKDAFAALDLDAAIVVAYGLILPKAVLAAPKYGCINLHGSLLPRWRGAAPMQRAIMAGDLVTGVQTMQMEAGLDTGPVYLTAETPITQKDTAGSIHDRLAELGGPLLLETLAGLDAGTLTAEPQAEDGVTYAHKLGPEDTRIDWTKPAAEIDCQIRGLSPFPGAWFEVEQNGKRVRVKALMSELTDGKGDAASVTDDQLTIACGDDYAVRLTRVQKAGKSACSAEDFLRGNPLKAGDKVF